MFVSSTSVTCKQGQRLGPLATQTPSTPATLRGTLPHLSCWEKELGRVPLTTW